jgi:plastocyanin
VILTYLKNIYKVAYSMRAFLVLTAGFSLLLAAASVHAQTYGTSTTSSSSSVSSVPFVPSVPSIGVTLEPDRHEALPGDEVRYWITVHNMYGHELPAWKMAFFFDRPSMTILDAGGGMGEGDHIIFAVPAMWSGEQRTYSVRVRLIKNLRAGTRLRTYASMIWDGTMQPACAKNDLLIIARAPVTGAGDNTGPVEDLQAFLRPVNSARQGSALPLTVWTSVLALGLGVGGRLAKRFV